VALFLLQRNIGHLQLGIGLVPIAADVLESKTEWFALGGYQRRLAKIDGIWIRPTGLQDVQRHIFGLRDFSERISERDVDGCVRNNFIASVGHGSVDVGYAGPHKILRCAHFQIRKF
jgi:hypothetical protein